MSRKQIIFEGKGAELRVEENPGKTSVTISVVENGQITGQVVMDRRQFLEIETMYKGYGENTITIEHPEIEVSVGGAEFSVTEDGERD